MVPLEVISFCVQLARFRHVDDDAGGFITLSSVVVVDMGGLDRLTNAYGLCLLCLGVAALIGPPLNGTHLLGARTDINLEIVTLLTMNSPLHKLTYPFGEKKWA